MADFQVQLVSSLASVDVISSLMRTRWAWPICESLHFIGLSLLVGMIGSFDLRLLGVAKRVPIAALHRLIPWGILGYVINIVTGAMFLMTEPDQYIYNPAFHFKLLFMAVAGLNVTVFYLAVFRPLRTLGAGADAPRSAKFIASTSLLCWVAVMVCGRLLTFYRPDLCGPQGPGFLSVCIP